MTLEKAIEILSLLSNAPDWVFDEENRNSIKLGIEALKRVRLNRQVTRYPYKTLLPGETED